MPLKIDVKKKLNARSDRVKCVDLHPTEPWVLASLYDGNVFIYNYESQSIVKSFEVTDQPIRAGRFIARKQWIVIGSDDMFIRVYNYNTTEKIYTFEAHMDYIRALAVHPTLPYLLSSSDDMLIKLWDWEKGWANTMVFESHSHYVMQIAFNPKDANTFASASLDHTIKVWNLSSQVPNFTLEGHEKGVNCVDYYTGGDKPYLVSGGDDGLVKIWDYQTKACVQTLEGHGHNVSCVAFLPDRPLVLSGSEDGTVNLWHSNTYRLESTLSYGLDRCWSVSYLKGSNNIALGYDNGTVVIMLGKDQPVASIDGSGKIILAKHNEIVTQNIRSVDPATLVDGERLQLPSKELGSCEVYPQKLEHSPNGRFVAVCGDGEFIIYTALAWRNKSYGQADELVWDAGGGEFATRVGGYDIRVFNKAFNERQSLRPAFSVEGLYGGALIGLRGSDFVAFYDWETLQSVRRIDVVAENIFWSDDGSLVAIASDTSFFLLKFNRSAVDSALDASGGQLDAEGVEDAFELTHEIAEKVVTGRWVGDCFIYTNSSNRLNYCVGAEVSTLAHLDRAMFILGYLPKDNRIYLVDKAGGVISYTLLLSVLEYKTAIVRGDMNAAEKLLPRVPTSEHNKIARFLDSQGMKELALQLATDEDYRCELAIALGRLDLAASIARSNPSELKWRQLASLATVKGDFALAKECMQECNDFSGLVTLFMSTGDRAGLCEVGDRAAAAGKMNIAFLCYFSTSQTKACFELLLRTSRFAEAAFFARTYVPAEIPRAVELWKADLRKRTAIRVSEAIASPDSHAHMFPDHDTALESEKAAAALYEKRLNMPATAYADHKDDAFKDLSELFSAASIGAPVPEPGNGHVDSSHPNTAEDRGDDAESSAPTGPYTSVSAPNADEEFTNNAVAVDESADSSFAFDVSPSDNPFEAGGESADAEDFLDVAR